MTTARRFTHTTRLCREFSAAAKTYSRRQIAHPLKHPDVAVVVQKFIDSDENGDEASLIWLESYRDGNMM